MGNRELPDNLRTRQRINGSGYVKAAVFIFDFTLLNLLFLFFLFCWKGYVPGYFHQYTRITVLVMNFSMLVAEYFFHTIVERRLIRFSMIFINTFKLVVTQATLMFLSLKAAVESDAYFSFIVLFTLCELVVMVTSRIIERSALNWLRHNGRNSQTVLFVGSDPSLLRLYKDLTMSATVGYRVLGYYADSPIANAPESLEWRGNIADLNEMLDQWDKEPLREIMINEVFCSLPHDEGAEVVRIMRSCDKSVIRFYYVPRIFEGYDMKFQLVKFGGHTVYTNRTEPLARLDNRLIKRLFDLVISLCVMVFLVPITLVVGLIIKLQSPGPIFFRQGRTGLDGRTFFCYKFRSMHVNKDSDSVQATRNDPRKFPFGNFMRKTNIDELPQFFNVLRGDMSIVGPRPHMLHHTEVYGKLIDKYMVRHFCKPGITGWAQVTGFRGETQELWQMEERVKRDIWYIENWNVWLDIKIMWLTAKSVIIPDAKAY